MKKLPQTPQGLLDLLDRLDTPHAYRVDQSVVVSGLRGRLTLDHTIDNAWRFVLSTLLEPYAHGYVCTAKTLRALVHRVKEP